MELTYKNGFGERLVLKLINNKVWFKHDDITDEFIRLSGEYVFDGYIADKNNNTISDFEGELYITVFDKKRTRKCLLRI